MAQSHYVIIMAGGVGTRFWPMSRKNMPKQFLDILNRGRTLLQETFDRFSDFVPPSHIYVVTNAGYHALVRQQLPELSDDQILLEPVGRDTAPCVAYAAFKISQRDPEACFVVAPADHLIANRPVFRKNIELGLQTVAANDCIMTLGIRPTRPDTGYGYIQFIEDKAQRGFFKVKTFTEKPNLELAKRFISSGDFLWNGGIFLFSCPSILKAFHEFMPDTAELFAEIADTYYTPAEAEAIRRVYATCRPISIDYGIMEKADNVYSIPSDFGWSDLGTWGSVYENSDKDAHGNVVHGRSLLYEAADNIIHVEKRDKIVVLKGLEGYIVIDTGNALLVCKKEDEQFIKQIVGELKAQFEDDYI